MERQDLTVWIRTDHGSGNDKEKDPSIIGLIKLSSERKNVTLETNLCFINLYDKNLRHTLYRVKEVEEVGRWININKNIRNYEE